MVLNSNRFSPEIILEKIKSVQDLACAKPYKRASEKSLGTLLQGEMELQGLMPWSSNYTFLVNILGDNQISLLAIYKPGEGERPLWDFPDQTLSQREFAAYLISQVLGWPSVPATVIREGPHGLGSVQLFIEAEYEAHYFNMRGTPAFIEDFRCIALFDYIINNADRKGGHCLKGKNGEIWAIDHGLTFHVESKLRTVIWEFCDEDIPAPLLKDLARLRGLMQEAKLSNILTDLLSLREVEAFKKRLAMLVSTRQFPAARMGRNVPFPPI